MHSNVVNFISFKYRQLSRFLVVALLCLVVGSVLVGVHYGYLKQRIVLEKIELNHIKHQIALSEISPILDRKSDALVLLDKNELYNILAFIQDSADRYEIGYNNVDYNSKHIAEVNVLRYEVNYPFNTSYKNLKMFLHDVFEQYHDSVVLSNVVLLRDDSEQEIVDGKVKLTIFLNDDKVFK